MSFHKLPNYVRTYRKKSGFSQDELAFLVGAKTGAKVCRYERFARGPSLRAVLAFEAVFEIPAREIFAGIYRQIERDVHDRSVILIRRLTIAGRGYLTARKLELLRTICARTATRPTQRP
jgi:transcriptional regulator with XRE-family HTH domain